MTEVAERLGGELLKLSADDRAALADILLDSLDEKDREEIESAWAAELDRRFEEIESGSEVGEPAAEVFRKLRERYS